MIHVADGFIGEVVRALLDAPEPTIASTIPRVVVVAASFEGVIVQSNDVAQLLRREGLEVITIDYVVQEDALFRDALFRSMIHAVENAARVRHAPRVFSPPVQSRAPARCACSGPQQPGPSDAVRRRAQVGSRRSRRGRASRSIVRAQGRRRHR